MSAERRCDVGAVLGWGVGVAAKMIVAETTRASAMLIKRLFDFLDEYADDVEATNAIFEHFRNMMTAVAVGAAGAWLIRRPITGLGDLIDRLAGFALAVIAVGLFYLAITNAGVRMKRAGERRWRVWLFGLVYALLAWAGLSTFATFH